MAEFASKGVGTAGLTTGIIGSAGWLLNGGLGNILGGGNNCACGDNMLVNRYEAGMSAKLAEAETEIKLRDANFYTLSEMGKLRDYVDAKIDGINSQICQQSVINAQITANLSCMQGDISTLMGLTKTIVPIDNVCPEPMKQYNSWTAPTTGA